MADDTFLIEDGLTHYGNALRFQRTHKNKFKFNPVYGKWYRWNGVVWTSDVDGEVMRSFHTQNLLLSDMAEACKDKKLKIKIQQWCKSSDSYNNLSSSERIARHMSDLSFSKGWDKKPFLFAANNGVINLKTGELQKPDQNDLLTLQSQVDYDKSAQCPLWEKFISEAFNEDKDVMHYVHKSLGYSLTGNNKEQIIFIGYGTGSNGKSTLLRIIHKILGDYAHTAARTTFQANKFNEQTNDIAQLVSKRFVCWSETRMSSSLDEEKIKAMTGGENQRARMLYQDFFEFQPIFKLWMFFNHKPIARDDSQGFWRRIRIIPFNHVFDGTDKDIDVKLSQELPGILNWLIKGCLMWQKEGLSDIPQAIQEATGEYQQESDPIAQWLMEDMSISDQKSEKASDLYRSYFNWAKREGLSDREILTSTMFGKRLTTKFKKIKTQEGIFYIGLEILKK